MKYFVTEIIPATIIRRYVVDAETEAEAIELVNSGGKGWHKEIIKEHQNDAEFMVRESFEINDSKS
jgi:hypothetical protein